MRARSCFWLARSAAALLAGALFCAAPAATAQPADEGGDKPEGWSSLSDSPDEPEPPPPPDSEPVKRGGNPYVAPEEPPPAPVDASEGEHGEEMSEDMAWMKDWQPRFARSHATLEFEVWSRERSTALTWDLLFQVAVGDDDVGAFDIDIPIAYSSGVESAMVGNPTLGGHGGGVLGDVVGLWGGAWLSIPTTTQDSEPEPLAVNFEAMYARALVNLHRFVPIAVPVRFGMGIEVQIHPLVYFRSEVMPILLIPTADGADAELTMDQVNELEALSPIGLGGGVRFQEAFMLTDGIDLLLGGDKAALALEPYVTYQPPHEGDYASPVFARVGLLFALNEPLGIGFDKGAQKVMTVRTAVGVRF